MKRLSIALLVSCLLTGCRFLKKPNENTEPTAEAVIEVDAKAEEAARIYHLLHSDEINKLNQKVAASPSSEAYLERGNAYLKLGKQENLYEAYTQARKDYEMAYFYNEELEDLSEQLYPCYEAEAEHAKEQDDLQEEIGWTERMNQLKPNEDAKNKLIALYEKERKTKAGIEEKEIYTDDEGNSEGYGILKYDDDGRETELSSYDDEDKLIDTFSDFQFDDDGFLVRSGVCDSSLKFTQYEEIERNEFGKQISSTIYAVATGKKLGTFNLEYDVLGRCSGYTIMDSYSGKVHSVVEYLYDADSYCIGMDEYDADGYLLSHTMFEAED